MLLKINLPSDLCILSLHIYNILTFKIYENFKFQELKTLIQIPLFLF